MADFDAVVIEAVEPLMDLEDNQRVVSVLVIAEYATLDPMDDRPNTRRLVTTGTEDLTPWQIMGMCQFVSSMQELDLQDQDL